MGKFQARRARRLDENEETLPEGSGHHAKTVGPAGLADFLAIGRPAAGEFHCRGCGYGVIVQRELPRCPMCSGTAWEQPGTRSIRRRATELLQ
jgi:rubrerythrin